MNELEERARRVLDVARAGHAPSSVDAARVRAALQARVLADPMLLEAAAPGSLAQGVLGKVLVALAVGGAAGFAAGLYVAQALAPVAHPVEAASNPAPRASVEDVVSESAVSEVGASPADTAPSTGVEAPSSAGTAAPRVSAGATSRAVPPPRAQPTAVAGTGLLSPLKAELDGLRRAQELLHRGEPAWALARLNELDRAQVGSVLLEERTATRAIAECMLGKDSKTQTDEFARRFPGSAHLERVRTSCAKTPQAGAPAQNAMPR